MLYWSPIDLEQVFRGWDDQEDKLVELSYKDVLLQVQPLGDGMAKVVRVISSNPSDYLRKDLAPGEIIAMN